MGFKGVAGQKKQARFAAKPHDAPNVSMLL